QIEVVHGRIFGDSKQESPRTQRPVQAPADLDDAAIIERASRAKNGAKFRALWQGDTTGDGSQSEADLALANHLAFYCGPGSEERIAALFAQSGLFRSKWQREDYRTRTIAKALQDKTEFYDPGRARHPGANGNGRASAQRSKAGSPTDDEE